ncbi:MAG: laccase domain-containing protein [Legionella sp.]|nr:laccase domain-containing protein [Legionella sp.]
MKRFSKPDNISAVVSPCITQDSYEVDSKFYKEFLSTDRKNTIYFKNSKNPEHFLFDLFAM